MIINIFSFGAELKNIRMQLGITQDNIASALNMSRATVSRWEKGLATPSMKHVNELKDYLDFVQASKRTTLEYKNYREI